MVNMSLPIFPNCKITLSCSASDTLCEGSTAATSWKFFTEATVTRPLKLRHQHCNCSCHLGDLFLRIVDSSEEGTFVEEGNLEELHSLAVCAFLFETNEEDVLATEFGSDIGVGAVPPSWTEEIGIVCISQFILLGPLVRRTLSSYEMVAVW